VKRIYFNLIQFSTLTDAGNKFNHFFSNPIMG